MIWATREACYIPSTYLSYNWEFVSFDHLSPVPPLPNLPDNHKSDLFSYEFVSFGGMIDLKYLC